MLCFFAKVNKLPRCESELGCDHGPRWSASHGWAVAPYVDLLGPANRRRLGPGRTNCPGRVRRLSRNALPVMAGLDGGVGVCWCPPAKGHRP
jgi:hypothetical protein